MAFPIITGLEQSGETVNTTAHTVTTPIVGTGDTYLAVFALNASGFNNVATFPMGWDVLNDAIILNRLRVVVAIFEGALGGDITVTSSLADTSTSTMIRFSGARKADAKANALTNATQTNPNLSNLTLTVGADVLWIASACWINTEAPGPTVTAYPTNYSLFQDHNFSVTTPNVALVGRNSHVVNENPGTYSLTNLASLNVWMTNMVAIYPALLPHRSLLKAGPLKMATLGWFI